MDADGFARTVSFCLSIERRVIDDLFSSIELFADGLVIRYF
jgi:hypothetical protein